MLQSWQTKIKASFAPPKILSELLHCIDSEKQVESTLSSLTSPVSLAIFIVRKHNKNTPLFWPIKYSIRLVTTDIILEYKRAYVTTQWYIADSSQA